MNTPPSTASRPVLPSLSSATTADELLGALEAVLHPSLGSAAAKSTSAAIVMDACYDTAEVLGELNPTLLRAAGIPAGRHSRVLAAIFGTSPPPFTPPPVLPPQFVPHPPPLNTTQSAPRKPASFKAEWPAVGGVQPPMPEKMLDFGLALRGYLRELPELVLPTGDIPYSPSKWADVVFDRFTAPWTALPAGFVESGPHDRLLCAALLSAGAGSLPPWAAALVRHPLSEDRGLHALLVLNRQVFTATDVSDGEMKRAIRRPSREGQPSAVARRLAQWDSDLSALLTRGRTVDDQDRRAGLLRMVEGLDAFTPAIAALEAAGSYTAEKLRVTLGLVADKVKSPTKKAFAAVTHGARLGAAKNLAAKLGGFAASRGKQAELCRLFLSKGTCRFGSKCKFSHSHNEDNKKAFIAACELFYDAGDGAIAPGVLVRAVLLQATLMGVAPEGREVTTLIATIDRLAGKPSWARAAAASSDPNCVKSPKRVGLPRSRSVPACATPNPFGALSSLDPHVQPFVPLPLPRPSAGVFLATGSGCGGGPLNDSGADASFIGAAHMGDAGDVRSAPACVVSTGNGTTVVNKVATVPGVGGMLQQKYVLPNSLESLCATTGCGFVQDPGNGGARYWHPSWPGEFLELEPDGRVFRVPVDAPVVPWLHKRVVAGDDACAAGVPAGAFPVTRSRAVPIVVPPEGAGVAVQAAGDAIGADRGDWYQTHCERGHPYDSRCDHCVRGSLKARAARRVRGPRKDPGGYIMAADFTGRHSPDVDGNTIALVATVICLSEGATEELGGESEAAYGFVRPLANRRTAAVASALDDFEVELLALGKDPSRCIVRFHTDVDKSFMGRVRKLAVRKGWTQTDTGGYRPKANSLTESRVGQLKRTSRTLLLAATGGAVFYVQLWGNALAHANYCRNRGEWATRSSPFEQLTGAQYEWDAEDHAFGEMVTFLVPEECRDDTYRPPGERGIWVGREGSAGSSGSIHSARVVPIFWDPDQLGWVLGATVTSNSFKVHKGVYPLRMRPPKGEPMASFDKFLDAVFDPLLAAAGARSGPAATVTVAPVDSDSDGFETCESGSDSEEDEEEFEIEAILNRRQRRGRAELLVKWKGCDSKHNTWEPLEAVHADELLPAFEVSGDTTGPGWGYAWSAGCSGLRGSPDSEASGVCRLARGRVPRGL